VRADLSIDRAAAAWRRHPADYLAAGLCAQALLQARDPRAVAVVTEAAGVQKGQLALPHRAQALVDAAKALPAGPTTSRRWSPWPTPSARPATWRRR
jgi:hypothetical protein